MCWESGGKLDQNIRFWWVEKEEENRLGCSVWRDVCVLFIQESVLFACHVSQAADSALNLHHYGSQLHFALYFDALRTVCVSENLSTFPLTQGWQKAEKNPKIFRKIIEIYGIFPSNQDTATSPPISVPSESSCTSVQSAGQIADCKTALDGREEEGCLLEHETTQVVRGRCCQHVHPWWPDLHTDSLSTDSLSLTASRLNGHE